MKKSNLGYVLVLVAALMWGSIGIFVNGISAMGVSSQSMAAFRLLVGALILAPVLMFMGCRPGEGSTVAQGPLALFKASPKELVPCALVGIVGLAAANTCYYECMGEVGMSTASVLLYTSPVFGVMLGRVLYREDVTPNKLVAIVFNIVGCVLAVTNGDLSGFHFSVWGVTSGVIAGLCGASLAVFSRIATKTVHPLAVTFWGFVFGGAVMAAIAAPWPDVAAAMSPQLLLLFLGFGLIPTAVAYILYMQGLSMGLETSKVPVVMSFETVVTVLLGIGVYAELAALINEARTGLTNPNAPVEAAAAPAKKAKASRHSSGPAKIVLARLDYRLLHGQVVFTWTTKVQAERIIVVDNAAANDDIKKGALKLAKPQGVRLNVFTVERALAKMDKLNTLGERVMFVFGNTAEMLQFCQGYKLDAINLGATANHDGADQVGGKDSSVFLDATQKADVNQLLDMGIKLYVQQTPTYQSVDIDAKL